MSDVGKTPLLSSRYMVWARPHCLRLLEQAARLASSLALARAGSSMAARIAMTAMTTSNSIRVKPARQAARWPSPK